MLNDRKQEEKFEVFDTLFYQGNSNSQAQIVKYTGGRKVKASTGELMWCSKTSPLPPLNVIFRPFIGPEIADVFLFPNTWSRDYIDPRNWPNLLWCYGQASIYGYNFASPEIPTPTTVRYFGINRDKSCIGQETDIESHQKKYQSWKQEKDKSKNLVLYGVSRGTAATFIAMAKEKYKEVKLIILEGAIDSIENVKKNTKKYIRENLTSIFVNEGLGTTLTNVAEEIIAEPYFRWRFKAYNKDGPSPLKSVAEFPEAVPVVFITSLKDTIVFPQNTINIAEALAKKGKNDVFLLTLKKSSHPTYMFDDKEDRDNYEYFIHAIYKKYNLVHDSILAEKGTHLLEGAWLNKPTAGPEKKPSKFL